MKNSTHKMVPFIKFAAIFLVGIALIVTVVGSIIFFSFSKVVGKDSYTIGDVEIPSISFVLQEKRSAQGFSVNTESGQSVKTIHYRATPNPLEDINTYATYLQEEEGFVLSALENEGMLTQKILLYREYPELQSVIAVELHCDLTQYSIVLIKKTLG